MLEDRGVDTAGDRARRAAARPSSGAGEYGWDLNQRETLDTQLNVFAEFDPKLTDAARGADVLFLANIQPELQREVRAQCRDARFVALDSMNLWIETARESLIETVGEVDCLMLNDAELRQLTRRAEPGPRGASGARVGASRGGRQAGRVRRGDDHRGGLLRVCRPSRSRRSSIRPAPGTPSPAASWATSLRIRTRDIDHELLCRAMAYGTALASFNVEEFGVERVARLTSDEIADRVARPSAHHAVRREADAARLRG